MSRIIDGKAISAAVKARIQGEVSALNARGVTVGLAVIIVGENPASKIYVANKKKACEALGIVSEEYALSESTTEQELLELINTLNNKKSINGILCQLPLPPHLDEKLIINSIAPEKDVDAFNPYSVGRIMIGDYDFVPCTPAGIMEMLKYEGIEIAGKSCVAAQTLWASLWQCFCCTQTARLRYVTQKLKTLKKYAETRIFWWLR